MSSNVTEIDLKEKQIEELIKNDKYEQAIEIYQNIQVVSARILHLIGLVYANKLGDYDLAISCFEQAIQTQEKTDKLTGDILNSMAIAYQNHNDFDLALVHHHRALQIRQTIYPIDKKLVATSLFGIANVYWGQEKLSEALQYAQQALTINESIESGNEMNIATNLAILANIYHHCGDDIYALELAQRALILLERCVASDSSSLAPLLNNIGMIQISMNMFNEALLSFIRALHICEKTLPEQHPKRIHIYNNIQQVSEMQQFHNINVSCSYLWNCLSKVLLF